jgi:hypothetical protein
MYIRVSLIAWAFEIWVEKGIQVSLDFLIYVGFSKQNFIHKSLIHFLYLNYKGEWHGNLCSEQKISMTKMLILKITGYHFRN